MNREQEIRNILVNNAIKLIADGGFESATTKAITNSSGKTVQNIKMNEVYIYRLFGSKEDLYATMFKSLDQEIFIALRSRVRDYESLEAETKKKLYEIFIRAWRFLLGNEERCRCYVRYYYSSYFKGESLKKHNALFAEIVNEFSHIFRDGADVSSIMHSVFTALLDFAIRVYNGELKDCESTERHVFNVLYCMMMTYLKTPDNSEARVSITTQN